MPASAAALQTAPVQPDLAAVKTRQQAAWSSGDYAIVGTTLQIVGEDLCECRDHRRMACSIAIQKREEPGRVDERHSPARSAR